MSNNRKFANPTELIKINFPGDTGDSDNATGTGLENRGTGQLRRLGFPSAWVTSDVSFIVFEDDTYTSGKVLYITDGVDNVPLVLSNCTADTTVSLQAPWIDSANYFQIVSSNQQPALEVDAIFSTIYQVTA
jgi:hypothetical protein